ncbi:MAG: hypothetical protein LBT12_03385 [Oscillospiraceae bacterium]|jgi:uncharacterized membrane protein YcgQ (UPF0703/DUF1980 family)/predicted small lipoprotein YifL|nr:hypothetical protein [Oscillospiraceae bacterium]
MKRTSLVLAVCLCLLAGCGGKTPGSKLPPSNSNGTQAIGTFDSKSPAAPLETDGAAAYTTDATAAPVAEADGNVIVIREKLFVEQTNDVYYNAEDYLGKTIQYEGIFKTYEVPETGGTYYSVIRYGPGCCGIDANAGFEVYWDGGYPELDDWVEAVGVLEMYEEDGALYLRLALTALTVLSVRGAEYVDQ